MPSTELEVSPAIKTVKTYNASAYAAHSATSPLTPFDFERREPGPHDVQIEILYCGICHSDLHTVRNEWGPSTYPWSLATRSLGASPASAQPWPSFHPGDTAGVGCIVDSCRQLRQLSRRAGELLRKGLHRHLQQPRQAPGGMTFGGYSEPIVVDEAFRAQIPEDSIWRPRRRCCAPASRPIRRCATGRWATGQRSASSVSAAWATWG